MLDPRLRSTQRNLGTYEVNDNKCNKGKKFRSNAGKARDQINTYRTFYSVREPTLTHFSRLPISQIAADGSERRVDIGQLDA